VCAPHGRWCAPIAVVVVGSHVGGQVVVVVAVVVVVCFFSGEETAAFAGALADAAVDGGEGLMLA